MNTYIVEIEYTFENEIKEHRVIADTPMQAVLQAGAFARGESEGNCDTFVLLSVDEVVQTKKRVWG